MSFKKYFILFLLICSVLPISLLGIFLIKESSSKFDERFKNLQNTAILYAQEHFHKDLESLELYANQLTYINLNQHLVRYFNSKNKNELTELLKLIKDKHRIDTVALIDTNAQLLYSTGEFFKDNLTNQQNESVEKLIRTALRGKSLSAVDRLIISEDSYELFYLVMVPVFSENKHVLGILVLGQQISDKYAFQEIIHQASKAGGKSSAFKFRVAKDLSENILNSHRSNLYNITSNDFYFEEDMNNISYTSKPVMLLNFFDEPVGYLIVSLSKELEQDLYQKKLLILLSMMVVGAILIFFFARWFNFAFIQPFNLITDGFQDISKGNFQQKNLHTALPADMQKTVDAFNQMVRELAEKDQMRRSFISTLSHDLRTPLIAQRRVLELINEDSSEMCCEIQKLTNGLYDNNEHLLSMVNVLLETFQYEEGKHILNFQKINLFNLIQECFALLQPLASKKYIELINEIPPELYEITIDDSQIKRVFINLISNAIENIPDRSFVKITATKQDNYFSIQVIDNGQGISTEDLPYIFERYYSAQSTKIRKKIGSGLGLYICKMIIEAHHGEISVKSSTEGTVFEIRLFDRLISN